MTKRTKQEIINSILTTLRSENPEASALWNLQEGSRFRDILISQGVEIEKLEEVIESIYEDIFIMTASEEALELKLQGRGLSRLGGLSAKLTMRIGSTVLPDRTINIPQLFEIATNDDTPIIFRTTEANSIDPSTPVDTKGYYTVEIEAESADQSTRANVSVETVTNIITQIAGIDIAYNMTAGVGGRSIETIASMRNRLIDTTTNFDRGTEGWFITETKQNFDYVREVVMVRGIYGNGSVGLFIKGYSPLDPPQLQDIEDYYMAEERSDAAGWNVEVDEISTVNIDITMTVYRSNSDVDETLIQTKTEEYFNTLGIGYDFIVNRYIMYMLSNIDNLVDMDITIPASSRVEIAEQEIAGVGTITITSFEDASEE